MGGAGRLAEDRIEAEHRLALLPCLAAPPPAPCPIPCPLPRLPLSRMAAAGRVVLGLGHEDGSSAPRSPQPAARSPQVARSPRHPPKRRSRRRTGSHGAGRAVRGRFVWWQPGWIGSGSAPTGCIWPRTAAFAPVSCVCVCVCVNRYSIKNRKRLILLYL